MNKYRDTLAPESRYPRRMRTRTPATRSTPSAKRRRVSTAEEETDDEPSTDVTDEINEQGAKKRGKKAVKVQRSTGERSQVATMDENADSEAIPVPFAGEPPLALEEKAERDQGDTVATRDAS